MQHPAIAALAAAPEMLRRDFSTWRRLEHKLLRRAGRGPGISRLIRAERTAEARYRARQVATWAAQLQALTVPVRSTAAALAESATCAELVAPEYEITNHRFDPGQREWHSEAPVRQELKRAQSLLKWKQHIRKSRLFRDPSGGFHAVSTNLHVELCPVITPQPTAGDVLVAALRAFGLPVLREDRDDQRLGVVVPTSTGGGLRIVLFAGEDVSSTHPPYEHADGWVASLRSPDAPAALLYTGTAGDCVADSVICARTLDAWVSAHGIALPGR